MSFKNGALSCFVSSSTLIVLIMLMLVFRAEAQTTIPANDARICYLGRCNNANAVKPEFDWAGVSIAARFSGTSISFKLNCNGSYFVVYVDDVFNSKIGTGSQTYTVSGLSSGIHRIIITKQNEAYNGIASFEGFVLPAGTTLLDPVRPRYKIELLGDSFSVGYGADATSTTCSNGRQSLDNAYSSMGWVAARAIDAECRIISGSGRGIVHNLGDGDALSSSGTISTIFLQTLFSYTSPAWNFAQWTPDIVVIEGGVNDLNNSSLSKSQFITGYRALIATIHTKYPSAKVLCFPNGMFGTSLISYAQEAYNLEVAAGHSYVYFGSWDGFPQAQLGCDWHPNTASQQKIADVLVPLLRPLLSATGTITMAPQENIQNVASIAGARFTIVDVRGCVVQRIQGDHLKREIDRLSGGVYFIRADRTQGAASRLGTVIR